MAAKSREMIRAIPSSLTEAPLSGERLSSDFSPPSLVHPKSVDPCRLEVPERSSENEGACAPVDVRG